MSHKVNIFSITGQQVGTEEFESEEKALEYCNSFGLYHSGFAQLALFCQACDKEVEERINGLCEACHKAAHDVAKASSPFQSEIMAPPLELTPQDQGAPSTVPYSVMIQRPSFDIDPTGREVIKINLALSDLSSCHLAGVPAEVMPFVVEAGKAFRRGYYRFELVVGDWSIKVYKHPNN